MEIFPIYFCDLLSHKVDYLTDNWVEEFCQVVTLFDIRDRRLEAEVINLLRELDHSFILIIMIPVVRFQTQRTYLMQSIVFYVCIILQSNHG